MQTVKPIIQRLRGIYSRTITCFYLCYLPEKIKAGRRILKRSGMRGVALRRMFDPDKDYRMVNEEKKYNTTQKAKAAARKKHHSFNKMKGKINMEGPQSFKEYKNVSK